MIEAGKRYHVVGRTNEAGQHVAALVEGIPSFGAPEDPKQDRNDGPALIEGQNATGSQFWADVLAADIVWTDRGWKRFYEYAPSRAERIRSGTEQS